MGSREPSAARAKKGASLSVILGTLLVPLSAFAASTVVESTATPNSSTRAEASPLQSSVVTQPDFTSADLETACGDAGLAMVAAETAGSIGELQQAALDALRGICSEQGMPLPSPATTQAVVSTAAQPASSPARPIDEVVVASDDDDRGDDHDRHGDDDHDHDEDDDDDQNDDEHDGEDHD